jgi:hypothetical protein
MVFKHREQYFTKLNYCTSKNGKVIVFVVVDDDGDNDDDDDDDYYDYYNNKLTEPFLTTNQTL